MKVSRNRLRFTPRRSGVAFSHRRDRLSGHGSGRHGLRRAGAAAVEFALIAPLMMTFTFGLVELGRLMLVKESAVQATREGAREAIRPSADRSAVIERVNAELSLMSVNDATVVVSPSSLDSVEPGGMVTVSVSIPLSAVSWVPGYFDFEATTIVAETTMRRESTN